MGHKCCKSDTASSSNTLLLYQCHSLNGYLYMWYICSTTVIAIVTCGSYWITSGWYLLEIRPSTLLLQEDDGLNYNCLTGTPVRKLNDMQWQFIELQSDSWFGVINNLWYPYLADSFFFFLLHFVCIYYAFWKQINHNQIKMIFKSAINVHSTLLHSASK